MNMESSKIESWKANKTMLLSCLLAFLPVINAELIRHVNPCQADGFLGDVALTNEQKVLMTVKHRTRRAVTNEKKRIWPHGIIPYVIKNVFTGKDRSIIHAAIKHWESRTCLSFVSRTAEMDYVVFQRDGLCGCCSYVGRMGGNRSQGVNLGPDCVQLGTVIHELGHVIGFWHEHTRPDRDAYINILRENILRRELKNFRRKTHDEINSLGVPYDFGSIMHYAASAFSKNGLDATILPRAVVKVSLGQREKLSAYDIKQANLLYKCPACMKTFVTSSGQFGYKTSRIGSSTVTTCIWRIMASSGEKIVLKFNYAWFRFSCRKVFMEVRAGKHGKSRQLETFCKRNKPPKEYVVPTDSVWIKFHYGYQYFYDGIKPIGVDVEFKVICGGDVRGKSGTILSPNSPDFYPQNKTCVWNIFVPKGMRIHFRFNLFKLEKSKRCKSDSLKIFDAQTSRRLGKFCGKRTPSPVLTSGHTAKVIFTSDASVNKPGFSLAFFADDNISTRTKINSFSSTGRYNTVSPFPEGLTTSEPKQTNPTSEAFVTKEPRRTEPTVQAVKTTVPRAVCGQKTAFHNGWLTTPHYPAEYNTPGGCKWHLSTERSSRYDIRIKELVVNSDGRSNCTRRIFSLSEIAPGRVVKRYTACELSEQKTISTWSNKVSISMNLKGSESVKFKIYLRSLCGGRLIARRRSQALLSPLRQSVSNLSRNQKCKWLIVGNGKRISLRIEKFDLSSIACSYDYLDIYDGDTVNSPKIKRLCGHSTRKWDFQSTNSNLLLVFNTGSSRQSQGFVAKYKTLPTS